MYSNLLSIDARYLVIILGGQIDIVYFAWNSVARSFCVSRYTCQNSVLIVTVVVSPTEKEYILKAAERLFWRRDGRKYKRPISLTQYHNMTDVTFRTAHQSFARHYYWLKVLSHRIQCHVTSHRCERTFTVTNLLVDFRQMSVHRRSAVILCRPTSVTDLSHWASSFVYNPISK